MHPRNTYMDTEGPWRDLDSLLEVQGLEITPIAQLSSCRAARQVARIGSCSNTCTGSRASHCLCSCAYLQKLHPGPHLVTLYVLLVAL